MARKLLVIGYATLPDVGFGFFSGEKHPSKGRVFSVPS